jgi:hypothetical protein
LRWGGRPPPPPPYTLVAPCAALAGHAEKFDMNAGMGDGRSADDCKSNMTCAMGIKGDAAAEAAQDNAGCETYDGAGWQETRVEAKMRRRRRGREQRGGVEVRGMETRWCAHCDKLFEKSFWSMTMLCTACRAGGGGGGGGERERRQSKPNSPNTHISRSHSETIANS